MEPGGFRVFDCISIWPSHFLFKQQPFILSTKNTTNYYLLNGFFESEHFLRGPQNPSSRSHWERWNNQTYPHWIVFLYQISSLLVADVFCFPCFFFLSLCLKTDVDVTHTIHGTGIFTYIYHKKTMIHVGKYTVVPWMVWVIIPSRFSNVLCQPFRSDLLLGFIPTVPHMSSLPHAAAPCEMILSFLAPKWGSKISLLEMGWCPWSLEDATSFWHNRKKVNGCIWTVASIGGTRFKLPWLWEEE